MPEHITVTPTQLSALSRSYQQISHRVGGISVIVAAAAESTGLTDALPGSSIAAAATSTCNAWADALRGAGAGIDAIAKAAENLAADTRDHQVEQKAALEALAW